MTATDHPNEVPSQTEVESPTDLARLLARLLDDRPSWRSLAACRGMDPELFFPGRGEDLAPIRAVCRSCPVAGPCLEDGMYEKQGVWGGLSERERRGLRPSRRGRRPLAA